VQPDGCGSTEGDPNANDGKEAEYKEIGSVIE
jgi:hypothetical protein